MPGRYRPAGGLVLRAKKKLARKGADEEVIEAALARITELGYLDDRAYAVRRAQLMAERGYGDRYIAYQLSEQGFPEALVDQALKALPAALTEERRIAILRKRLADKGHGWVRFLAHRGFSYDAIYRAIGEAPEE